MPMRGEPCQREHPGVLSNSDGQWRCQSDGQHKNSRYGRNCHTFAARSARNHSNKGKARKKRKEKTETENKTEEGSRMKEALFMKEN